jgi:hypothetical protein
MVNTFDFLIWEEMNMFKKYIKKIVAGVISDEFASVRETMNQEFASVLHDVTYRMGQLRELGAGVSLDGRRIQTSDLNLASHMIDGYTVANNSPSAGSVAWTDINIVYKGQTYTLANGNTTKKYLWWDFDAVPNTVLQVSDTKPTLTIDDVLVGINEGGTFTSTMTAGKLTPGSALMDGSIGSGELANGAVLGSKIANGAVGSGQLTDGAITEVKLGAGAVTSAKIGSGAVGSTALASGAVVSGKIAANAVGSTEIASNAVGTTQIAANAVTATQIGTGAVTAGKIGANAVTDTTIATGAVTSGKIGSGAVGSTALASGAVTTGKIASGVVGSTELANGAVTSGKIGTGAVGSGNIATGAVGSAQLGAGSIAEDKLNLATHFLF